MLYYTNLSFSIIQSGFIYSRLYHSSMIYLMSTMIFEIIIEVVKYTIIKSKSKNKIEITERSKVEGDTVDLKAVDRIASSKSS